MKRDDKILIAALILSLTLLFVGFSPDSITGYIAKTSLETTIDISPQVVSPGELIHVTVHPGSQGVHQKTSFYQAEDNLRKVSVTDLCSHYVCKEEGSFTFPVPHQWEPGVYHIKVYDYSTKTFITEDFTLVT